MISKRFIMVNTIVLLLFLLVSSDLISQEKIQKNDYRDSKWGMKKDKVLSSEKNKPLVAGPLVAGPLNQYFLVMYTGEVAGLKANYGYGFLDDVLVEGAYTLVEKHINMNKYINDYNKLKEILTRKYGSPKKSKLYWYNDLYKNSPQRYGRAVSMGHLGFQSDWETDRTLISLTLLGDNLDLSTILTYTSKLHKKLIDKADKKSEEQGL